MVRIQTDRPYTSVRREIRAQWRAPLGSSADRQPSNAGALQKAPVAVHHRSACSGLKALRNTSAARRLAAKLCYRFGPLIPSARSANLIAGDGTKNGFPAPNKELATNQKRPLDRKSPIQVRIHFPPADSPGLAGFRAARSKSRAFPAGVSGGTGSAVARDRAWRSDMAPIGGNISVGPNFSTAAWRAVA